MTQMIPKTIHYCWFGGNPKPVLVQRCIESWKQYCPDFEIIEWNESNFNIHSNTFVYGAYRDKQWAFVADYVRAFVLLQRGGIYLDADMELLQPLDSLLHNSLFAGFEANDTVATCIIGCSKGNEVIHRFYEYYRNKPYRRGKDLLTSPIVFTSILREEGLKLNGKKQCVSDCSIYPQKIFCPSDLRWVFGEFSSQTVGVHHYLDSWGKNPCLAERTHLSKLRLSMINHARNILGTDTMYILGQKLRRIRWCK